MGAMIRKNKDIKGIQIMHNEYKLLQYADDTVILIDGSEHSLKSALSLIGQYAKFSGLKPNYQKTACIKIGPLRDTMLHFRQEYDLTWTQEPFTFLGIKFSVDLENMIELNFDAKVNDIKKMIQSWNRRYLSTAGKITVVKSILLPKLTHLFIALPNPPENWIKELERIFFHFIWKSKKDRVARKTLIQDYSRGGLRMICLSSFIKGLKMTWIRRILTCNEDVAWKKIRIDMLPTNFRNHLNYAGNYYKAIAGKINNPFWQDVFLTFHQFRDIIEINEKYVYKNVWFNNEFKINGKPVFYENWFKKGIVYVYDFLDSDGRVLDYNGFCEKFNFWPPFTLYYGIVSGILANVNLIDNNFFHENQPYMPYFISILLKNIKGASVFYDIFVKCKYERPKCEVKWENELNLHPEIGWWEKQNSLTRSFTNDITLRWFHYRLLHRILGTKALLFKIGLSDSNMCTFCNEYPETIAHLFYTCRISSQLWTNVFHWVNETLYSNIACNDIDILLGKTGLNNRPLNVILCLTKRYIYKQKLQNHLPLFTEAKKYIQYYMKTDLYIMKKNMRAEAFEKYWRQYAALMNN